MGYNPGYVDGVLVPTDASYVPGLGLFKVLDNVGGGVAYWVYITTDNIGAVQASGYVSDATNKRLKVGDIVDVFSGTLTSELASSPAGLKLGAVTFPATQGLSSLFSSQPVYARMICSAVAAAAGNAPGAGTLALVSPNQLTMAAAPRNLIDGGDASVNPWQRGTSFSNIAGTNTYTADRWFMVAGAGASATMTETANTGIPGFSEAFVWGRANSGSGTSTVYLGQALETLDSIRAQGQPVTLSFWAAANSGINASGSPLQVQIVEGFGTNQSASALVNNVWTAQTNVNSSSQVLTSTLTRYAFSGLVSNSATQLGVLFSYLPASSSAVAGETIVMEGIQLEIGAMTPFEHRDIEVELALCQRYFFQASEPASGVIVGAGAFVNTNSGSFVLQLPVQMRAAPTVTVSQGSFGTTPAYTALSSFAANTAHTPNYIGVVGKATATSGTGAFLVGGGGTGYIQASADL